MRSADQFACSDNRPTSLPAELGLCTLLIQFGCGANQLTEFPAELGRCTKLEDLFCGDNRLTAEAPQTPQGLWDQWGSRPHTNQ